MSLDLSSLELSVNALQASIEMYSLHSGTTSDSRLRETLKFL